MVTGQGTRESSGEMSCFLIWILHAHVSSFYGSSSSFTFMQNALTGSIFYNKMFKKKKGVRKSKTAIQNINGFCLAKLRVLQTHSSSPSLRDQMPAGTIISLGGRWLSRQSCPSVLWIDLLLILLSFNSLLSGYRYHQILTPWLLCLKSSRKPHSDWTRSKQARIPFVCKISSFWFLLKDPSTMAINS